jgi:hypothetical protein
MFRPGQAREPDGSPSLMVCDPDDHDALYFAVVHGLLKVQEAQHKLGHR